MRLVLERLPAATLVSVAHRVELEAFHTRKLVLEYADEGSRLIADEALQPTFATGPSKSRDQVRSAPRRPRPIEDPVIASLAPSRAHARVEAPEHIPVPALAPNAAPALAPSA